MTFFYDFIYFSESYIWHDVQNAKTVYLYRQYVLHIKIKNTIDIK